MDKENVVYLYNGVLLGCFKKIYIMKSYQQMDGSKNIMPNEVSQSQEDKYGMH